MNIIIPGLMLGIGYLLYFFGIIPLYYEMYCRYGLYELFNILVLFKFLKQHGKDAKPHMIRVILGIILVTVSAVWLRA
jgi:hypothetical protein